MTKPKKKTIRWHPAFYAAFQIELEEYADILDFRPEVPLGSEPSRADMVVCKTKDRPIDKGIATIFRTYNIIEYKSPTDALSVDAFHKACGYAHTYKAGTGREDEVKLWEITLTLVCTWHPSRLLRHLEETKHYTIETAGPGIYHVHGEPYLIQILVTSGLPEEEHQWLRNLTNDLKGKDRTRRLLEEYEQKKNNPLYRTVMDAIVHANWEQFEEVKTDMCDALMELMEDELHMEYTKGHDAGWEEGRSEEQQNGIRSLIQACQDLGASKETAIQRLLNYYPITSQQAEAYMKKYWK